MHTTTVGSHLVAVAMLSAVSATPAAWGADGGFEGRIQLRQMDADPQGASYTIHDARMRIDVPGAGGAHDVHVIVDIAHRTLTTSFDARHETTSVPLPELGAGSGGVAVHRAGRWRAVAGQPCQQWTLVDGPHTVQACVVPGVAWFDPRRIVGQEVPAWSRRLEAERVFPVSVWEGEGGPSSRTAFASWATDVTRQTVRDDAFSLPRTARKR